MTANTPAIIITTAVLAVSSFAAEPRFPTEDYKQYPLIEFTENGKAKTGLYIEPPSLREARELAQKLKATPLPLPELSSDIVEYHDTNAWRLPNGRQADPNSPAQVTCFKFVYAADGRLKNVYFLEKGHPTRLCQAFIYDKENRFSANIFEPHSLGFIDVVEYQPGAEVPSGDRPWLRKARFWNGTVTLKEENKEVTEHWPIPLGQSIKLPKSITRAANDKLPCQVKRFRAQLSNLVADPSLATAQRAAAIGALADIQPEKDEAPADEDFSYTALHKSVVSTLAGLKTKEAVDVLATLRDRSDIGTQARDAVWRSGDERFLPALPAGWEQADLKTKQEMTYKLFRPDATVPEFWRAVQALALQFHEVGCTSQVGTCKIVKVTLNSLGGRIDGIRFTTPPGEKIRFQWLLASPPSEHFNFYIVPRKGTMEGFRFMDGFPRNVANLPWPENDRVIQQSLEELQGDPEYLIWFALESDKPMDIYVAVNAFPRGASQGASGLKVFGLELVPKQP